MSLVPFLIILFLVYALPVSFGVFLILWLSKKKLDAELLAACIVPICIWLVLVLVKAKGKTLTNCVFEPAILAALVCVLAVVHCALNGRQVLSYPNLAILTVGFSAVFAVGVFFGVPALPE
jgi:hypothetical protein